MQRVIIRYLLAEAGKEDEEEPLSLCCCVVMSPYLLFFFLNFRNHVISEFQRNNIDYYILLGGQINEIGWRTFDPNELFAKINALVMKRLA